MFLPRKVLRIVLTCIRKRAIPSWREGEIRYIDCKFPALGSNSEFYDWEFVFGGICWEDVARLVVVVAAAGDGVVDFLEWDIRVSIPI